MQVPEMGTIQFGRGISPKGAELVLLSIDNRGTPGQLNRYVLSQLGLDDSVLPAARAVEGGFAIITRPEVTLVFIVTLGGQAPANALRKNLSAALRAIAFRPGSLIWVPLMATGAAGLAATESLQTIYEAVLASGIVSVGLARVVISAAETMSATEYEVVRLWFERLNAPRDAKKEAEPVLASDAGRSSGKGELSELKRIGALLAAHRRGGVNQLSTTTLFFALSLADAPEAHSALRWPIEARMFALVLKEAAGQRYQHVWDDKFLATARVALAGQAMDDLPPTKNVEEWLARAGQIGRGRGRQEPSMADVLEAMWDQRGNFNSIWQGMRVSAVDIEREWQRRCGATGEADHIVKHLLNDHATDADMIGFEPYADAIYNFLTSASTCGPISISIQAPWGAGKSSLMKQVQAKLEPLSDNQAAPHEHARLTDVLQFLNQKRSSVPVKAIAAEKCWTIWFNAWKYESSEQVWAGLVDAIISQVSRKLDPVERELFLLKLNLARVDDGKVRNRIYERLLSRLLPLAGKTLLLAPFVIALSMTGGLYAAIGVPVSTAVLLCAVLRVWYKIKAEPATFSLADYLKVPDYPKSAGVIHKIHGDMQRVVSVLPVRKGKENNARLVIFVDDLDRCSPNKVASIVEGINMFLASEQKEFMFVIGMDPQVVAAALEHAHKDIKSYLPTYEQTVPLGWRFMDKFVQLAFTIPPRTRSGLTTYIGRLATPVTAAAAKPTPTDAKQKSDDEAEKPVVDVAASGAGPRLSDEDREAMQMEASKTVTPESEDVLLIMRVILAHSLLSPREIKRAFNFVRLVLLLRIGRNTAGLPVPELPLYGRWIVLLMRWPDMARWLQWSFEGFSDAVGRPELEGITARRLAVLESAAESHPDARLEWMTSVAEQLRLQHDKVAWLADQDLYQFFRGEAGLAQPDRLSTAASVGFY